MELRIGKMLEWIYKSNPESLLVKVGIGDSKPAVMQEALARWGQVVRWKDEKSAIEAEKECPFW